MGPGETATQTPAWSKGSLTGKTARVVGRGRAFWRDVLRRRLLGLADLASVLLAGVTVSLLADTWDSVAWAAVTIPAWILLAKILGLYDRDHRALRHLTVDEVPLVVTWAVAGTALVVLVLTVAPVPQPDAAMALGLFAVVAVLDVALRGIARVAWRALVPPERTLILGDGMPAEAARRKLELFSDIHVQLVRREASSLGDPTQLDVAGIDRLIFASEQVEASVLTGLLELCRNARIKLTVVPPPLGMFGSAAELRHIADLPVLEYNTWHVSRSTIAIKRAFDVVVAGLTLLVLSPLILAIALAILVSSGRPVVLRQQRVGRHGLEFQLLKFRTMVTDAEARLQEVIAIDELPAPMFKVAADPRVTRLGRFLRRSSLDELPQLVNVLRGEMSLVGPRPEQVELVRRYGPDHRFRLVVKPGLTGPMQVFGRGDLSFEERLAVERDYIENMSLGRDLRILGLTLAAVFSRRGAY